jgi:hypothetical protein
VKTLLEQHVPARTGIAFRVEAGDLQVQVLR